MLGLHILGRSCLLILFPHVGDEVTVTPVTPSNSYRTKGPRSEPLVRLMIFFFPCARSTKGLAGLLQGETSGHPKGSKKHRLSGAKGHQTSSWGSQSGITTCRPSSPPEIRPFGSISSGFCRQYSREKPCSAIKTCHPNPPVKLEHFGWKLPPNQGRACILSNMQNT